MEPWQRDLAEYREAQFQAYREKRERFGEPITRVSKRKESDMKRYFDYTEKERSEMTAETVESLMARELMENGVVAPEKPVLEEVPTFEATKTRFYRVKNGSYGHEFSGFVFTTLADAEAFTKLDIRNYESPYGSGVSYVKRFEQLLIEPDDICDQDEYLRIKEVAEKAKTVKSANEKATKAYNDECKASRDITEGVWTDWRECREKAARMARIQKTYEEYMQLCDGQSEVAGRFLAKAYNVEQLQEADEWLGTSFAEPTEAAAIACHEEDGQEHNLAALTSL